MGTATQQVDSVSPYTEQEPFLWDRHRYYGFISGVGAGKTAVGVMRTALNASLWNPDSMGAIVAPSTRMIKNAIFPVMQDFGLREKWDFTGFQAEEPGFHTPEGTRIVILSADNERTVERLANLNLSFWWLDEAKETPKRARDVLRERLRVGQYRNGYITTTPKGYDHNYEFFVDKPRDREELDEYSYGQAKLYEASDRLLVGGVPSWANPHTPEDYHEEMRNLPDQIRAQQAEGRFIEIGGGVYDTDTFQFVSADTLTEDRIYEYLLGVDPAVQADSRRAEDTDSDYWAATLCALHRTTETLYAVDTKRQRGMTLTEGAEWVAAIAQQANADVLVESNQAQVWLAQELRDYNLTIREVQTTQNKEDKLIGMSIPLENGLVQFVNHEVDPQLGYDPRWQPLIQEALAFPEGSHDDLMDSLNLVVDNTDIHRSGVLPTDMYGRDDE